MQNFIQALRKVWLIFYEFLVKLPLVWRFKKKNSTKFRENPTI